MDISQKLKIQSLQTNISKEFAQDTLHILNGQAMYEHFSRYQLMEIGDYIPFNEAMCDNDSCADIFSPAFNRLRAEGHRVSLAEYEDVTMKPLACLLDKQYRCIVLWFGDDMFCQMNLLTVLAYLEQISFQGTVYYHMVQELTYDVEETAIDPNNYHEIYREVLLDHHLPATKLMPVMDQGIRLYLDYLQNDNRLTAYIHENIDQPQDQLLEHLFRLFPQYGLGDLQYIKMIDNVKE
ncbi:AraC family transcriptional regulator [Paenibacillus sp. FA6]|uniref:AraC family transcriptional regulator n=1 Tax=Paenibacillus sp. FA6 TaxID=3413029 RepID=UPI003F659E40